MRVMKKWFLYAAVLTCLSLALAACNKDEETPAPEKSQDKVQEMPEEESVQIPSVTDEVLYQKAVENLKAKGFTVGEPEEAAIDMFRAESGMALTINGEPLLPLHLYKLDASDQRLQELDETGELTVYVGSKVEKLAVKRIDHFIIYLHKAHPDYVEIMKVIDEI
ncbi:hypothetical protein SporoP37_02725 [Sporosarcina sp. P37]|uniref:hypothetical protein n=1 Tax=unclassified Sporosarcina TaxID=2647733 RepID=UPI0009BEE574|nr:MULTISPECIES: hypothetical protein [unclassified Sporosarcina]ARD47147.1 hypothetical protein SporoP33_02065 [Sporosarcina sp. P33]ARK23713.1 hypothetical protein SporoP37_02725 [Sporosarcina sp. P37]PID18860.1 hypothetical protein CSV62_05710 [Sporosarcina sp. P35]